MLTVLSVGYAFAPVTADPPGGSEQILGALDRALTAAGHRSIVVAQEGSEVTGELLTVPAPDGPIEDWMWGRNHVAMRDHIAGVVERERPDLVHLHGLDFGAVLPPEGPPTLVTLHLPLSWYAPEWLRPGRPRTWLQPVSASQAALRDRDVALLVPIPNGVDLDRFTPGPKGDRALIVGRVTVEKGFHDAIDAAKLAGVPLDAAGKVFPYDDHQRYFDEEVAPRLDERRRFLGPVEGAEKAVLLRQARCVLVPSTAPETSSLVAMEALASGTPVIAYRAGALPDIVEDGVTGFLVDDVAGMADAIERIGAIDPAACRAAASARFSLRRMIDEYLALYERLVA
jgi:glycosyltransferase involved in cell wall biosynthesis